MPTSESKEFLELAKQDKVVLELSDQEGLLIGGDLEKLTAEGRIAYYIARCKSQGLDPLSRPFDYIKVPGMVRGTFRLVLYANKNCAEQLREIHHISSTIIKEEIDAGVLRVYVRASKPIIIDGKILGHRDFDEVGAVSVAGIGATDLANARMKAVTKAHRRAALGIQGLGLSDESETETIRGAVRVTPIEVESLAARFDPPKRVGISQTSSVNNQKADETKITQGEQK